MAAYYDEKHKTWYVKFRYTDWQGNKKSTSKRGFKRKSDALRYEMDFKGESRDKPMISLGKLMQEYLLDVKKRRRATTYRLRETIARLYILPYLGKLNIADITPMVVRKWQNEIMEKKFSGSYERVIHVTLQTAMEFAVKYYGLAANPVAKTGKIGSYDKRTTFLELDEWEKLDAVVTDTHDKAGFNILFWGGLRVGELMALGPKDFDFKKNTVRINKQIQYGKEVPPKTKTSIRTITLPQKVMDLVALLIRSYYDGPPKYIFNNRQDAWSYTLRKYKDKIGRPDITPHTLRHSHVSLLIKKGVPINAISKRLGHASPTITLGIYAHVYKECDREIADILDLL